MTKQEYYKSLIDKIKDTQPKEYWPRMIAAIKTAPLPLDVILESTPAPCNVQSKSTAEIIAKAILMDDKNYMVRYLRLGPTVGLATVQPRHEDGSILVDAPTVRKRVICSGIPFACLIAFMHDSKLIIGWSKRIADRQLMETKQLHSLFQGLIEETQGISDVSDGYQNTFEEFSRRLVDFLSYQEPKEIEIPFSKRGGKAAAILRGLSDTISVNGSFITSQASGPVPHEVAKNLGWFIELAESTYGGKAANVAHPDQLPAEVPETESAVAVV